MADAFDDLLISTCRILRPASGLPDDSGHSEPTLELVKDDVPCRKSLLGGGRERNEPIQPNVSMYKVFMRPQPVDEKCWLEIEGVFYNVTDVMNPSGMNHHYEVMVTQVQPSEYIGS
jgi:hypothetical protein